MSKPTEPKYSKKTSFNRQKKYANSAMDIEKFDKKNEEYKMCAVMNATTI